MSCEYLIAAEHFLLCNISSSTPSACCVCGQNLCNLFVAPGSNQISQLANCFWFYQLHRCLNVTIHQRCSMEQSIGGQAVHGIRRFTFSSFLAIVIILSTTGSIPFAVLTSATAASTCIGLNPHTRKAEKRKQSSQSKRSSQSEAEKSKQSSRSKASRTSKASKAEQSE